MNIRRANCLARAALVVFPVLNIGHAVDLVREGKPAVIIVVPEQPLEVEKYAARELQYHVELSTGVRLPIVSEDTNTPDSAGVFLGATRASFAAHLETASLPGNGYVIRTSGPSLLIAGKDGRGNPLDADTVEGTLFAVYDLLEREAGVRWLWPGKLGEVVPRRTNLSLKPPDASVVPRLWFKHWRSGKSQGELTWLKRQRFGRSVQPQYGHSFGQYWQRFGKMHPEYFAMLPDGRISVFGRVQMAIVREQQVPSSVAPKGL